MVAPEFAGDLVAAALPLAVAVVSRNFLVEPFIIPSMSMHPAFTVGDQLVVDKISKHWRPSKHGDVAVFYPPQACLDAMRSECDPNEALIKRVVALQGEVVEVRSDGLVYIDGELYAEGYVEHEADYTFGPVIVPEGCVFVLGDNRSASTDSHVWGPLPEANIIGRAVLKFWPPWRAGFVAGNDAIVTSPSC